MDHNPATSRSSMWLKIVIPGAFALFVVAGLLIIVTGSVPDYAKPEAIEKRFVGQLELLRELAISHEPVVVHRTGSPDSRKKDTEGKSRKEGGHKIPDSEIELPSIVFTRRTDDKWNRKKENGKELMADPAILGASIILQCSKELNTQIVVKDYKVPDIWIPLSMESPELNQPLVKRWYTGDKRVVEYVNLFLDAQEKVRGYKLFLDLDRFQEPQAESNNRMN